MGPRARFFTPPLSRRIVQRGGRDDDVDVSRAVYFALRFQTPRRRWAWLRGCMLYVEREREDGKNNDPRVDIGTTPLRTESQRRCGGRREAFSGDLCKDGSFFESEL